jgi:hypothetical protein
VKVAEAPQYEQHADTSRPHHRHERTVHSRHPSLLTPKPKPSQTADARPTEPKRHAIVWSTPQ